jgi:tRNA nucleotidyltransferase (CCA-adding enzyme)
MKIRELYSNSETFKKTLELVSTIRNNGGRAFFVGGVVRDFLLRKTSDDFDLEIYGLEPDNLKLLVEKFGSISEVGKSFGVLKLKLADIEIDISIPREDSKMDYGHKGFSVKTDPYMSYEEAIKRRDFTINAILLDPLDDQIVDPSGGQIDLADKTLRITNHKKFTEDPLRVLRAMQFIGRFDLGIVKEDQPIYEKMVNFLPELPKERIGNEWRKLLTKSPKPSIGLDFAMDIGIIQKLSWTFYKLKDTKQDAKWHPEGNVWIHTKMVIDKMVELIRENNIDKSRAYYLILACLCHDFGKVSTTIYKDGFIKSPKHDQEGEQPTRDFLNLLGIDNETKKNVIALVLNHMFPAVLYDQEHNHNQKVSDGAIRKLAARLSPATIEDLVFLNKADSLGRGFNYHEDLSRAVENISSWLLGRAERLEVRDKKPQNFIEGRFFIEMGFKQGAKIGELVELANELHYEKGLSREDVIAVIQNDCSL